MKVLFPFSGDSVGGSHWSMINLYKELVKSPEINAIIVLHVTDGPLAKLLHRINIPYKALPVSKLAGENKKISSIITSILSNFLLFYCFVKNNKIDIVHGNDLRIYLTWSLPVRMSLSKYVWHQRQLLSKSMKWYLINFLSDYVISISAYVYNTLPSNIDANHKEIVNNPFNISTLNDKKKTRIEVCGKFEINCSCFILGYVGRLVSWKNIDTILYSLHEVLTLHLYDLDIHLLIVGEGDNQYKKLLMSIIKANKLENYVTFTGFVDDASLILSTIDLLIAPSTNEPFGRVLVESMLQKTLVVASDSGAHRDTIVHNKTGILFDLLSTTSLSNNIINIINKKKNYDSITKLAYKNAVNLYSSDAHANKVIAIYKNLLKSKL